MHANITRFFRSYDRRRTEETPEGFIRVGMELRAAFEERENSQLLSLSVARLKQKWEG